MSPFVDPVTFKKVVFINKGAADEIAKMEEWCGLPLVPVLPVQLLAAMSRGCKGPLCRSNVLCFDTCCNARLDVTCMLGCLLSCTALSYALETALL